MIFTISTYQIGISLASLKIRIFKKRHINFIYIPQKGGIVVFCSVYYADAFPTEKQFMLTDYADASSMKSFGKVLGSEIPTNTGR